MGYIELSLDMLDKIKDYNFLPVIVESPYAANNIEALF